MIPYVYHVWWNEKYKDLEQLKGTHILGTGKKHSGLIDDISNVSPLPLDTYPHWL